MLNEAKRLSRRHLLPILIGDNERTKTLEFNRSKPTPLSIPVFHLFTISKDKIDLGEQFVITYENDFIKFDDSIEFSLFNHYLEEPDGHHFLNMSQKATHYAKAWIQIDVESDFTFHVWQNKEKLHSFDFSTKG